MLLLRIGGGLLIVVGLVCGWIAWSEYGIAQREEQRGQSAVEKLKQLGPGPLTVERERLEIDAKYALPVAEQIKDGVRLYVIVAVLLLLGGVGLLGWSLRKHRQPYKTA